MAGEVAGVDVPGPAGGDPVLKDVVVLVEVRTKTENRSKGVEYQLEQLGAKVASKLTPDVTHVVWKNGKKPTLDRARKKGIHVVTVLWVESCKQNQEQVAESLFPVTIKDGESPLFVPTKRRRKFMEPKDFEEDIRDSRKRLAKRRKKDVPSPLSLHGRVLVKDTPHRQSPTWFLPGPPFSPSMIPHTPDSMRKCLDHLSAAKNRTPSLQQRPSFGDSPISGTFDSPGSRTSSPLEKPQVVGSLIERLLYSDNEEPSPLVKFSNKIDAQKEDGSEEKRPSLSKVLFPGGSTDQPDASPTPPGEDTAKKGVSNLSRKQRPSKTLSAEEGQKSRQSSFVSQGSTEAKSPEERRAEGLGETTSNVSVLKKQDKSLSAGKGQRSRRSSRISPGMSHSKSLDEGGAKFSKPSGSKLSRRGSQNKPPSTGKGDKSRRSSRLGEVPIQAQSPEEEEAELVEQPDGSSPQDDPKTGSPEKSKSSHGNAKTGQKSRKSSRLSRGPIQAKFPEESDPFGKMRFKEDSELNPDGYHSQRTVGDAGDGGGKDSNERTIIRDITNSQAQSQKDGMTSGKADGGKQLSRRPKKRTKPRAKPGKIETILLESSPEDTPAEGGNAGTEEVRMGSLDGKLKGSDRRKKSAGMASGGSKGAHAGSEKRLSDKNKNRADRDSWETNASSEKKPDGKNTSRTGGESCERADIDNVAHKLGGTPGQKRLIADSEDEGEEVPKRKPKRRKLLKMTQSYEDPPSVLIEPRESKQGDQGAGQAGARSTNIFGCTASGDGAQGRKAGKRLSSRLRKVAEVDQSSHLNTTVELVEPNRKSLEEFKVGKKKVADSVKSQDGSRVGNSKGSQQTVSTNDERCSGEMKTKGPSRGGRVNKKPTIVMTSMHKSELGIIVSVIRNLGGFRITDTVNEGTTHVVTGDSRRTLNVLSAIAHGTWLLSKEWVLNSLESGEWLTEEPFEVHNTFPAARLSRELKNQTDSGSRHLDLFSEYGSIFVSESSSPPRERLCDLIVSCGGSICKVQRQADLCVGACTSKVEVPTVQEKWVLDCISELKPLPIGDFKIGGR